VTTQLRLVEPPEPTSRPASGTKRASKGPAKGTEQSRSRRGTSRARTATVSRTGRRAAAWGDWRLDAGTRQVGRAGVAQARRALEQAALEQTALDQQLSQAS
jgi:hypothetical protein